MRRVLRIFPIYLAITSLFVVIESLRPQTLPLLSRDGANLFTYSYNLVSVWRQSHSSSLLPATPYSHFWSLCVEEQFYFVWPFLVYFLDGKRLRRFVVGMIVVAPIIRGCVAYAIAPHSSPSAAGISVYVLTTTHVDSFMLGAGLNLFMWPKVRAGLTCGITFGLMIATGAAHWWFIHWFRPDESVLLGHMSLGFSPLALAGGQHVWGYSVIAIFGAALINWAKQESPRGLAWSPLVHIGKVSYGAYIFHLPIMLLLFNGVNSRSLAGIMLLPVYILTVVGISTASFYGFERRFLNLKQYFSYSGVRGQIVVVRNRPKAARAGAGD